MQPESSSRPAGRILDHDAGLGEVSADAIEERARELAMIAGFTPDQVTDGHRSEAREELTGAVDPNGVPADDDPAVADIIAYDDAPDESGHLVAATGDPADGSDEETIGAALYSEGVAEATHDQMVESRREQLDELEEDDSEG